MTKLKLESIKKRIQKANKEFAKLTPQQKRVQIAQDVLDQLKAQKIFAERGTYLRPLDIADDTTNNPNKEIKDVLNKTKCDVCGIGSLFVCAVKRVDALKVSELINNEGLDLNDIDDDYNYFETIPEEYDIRKYLKNFFSERQLILIEDAFEGKKIIDDSTDFEGQREVAIRFNAVEDENYSFEEVEATEAMGRIMHNIINNKGTFRPDKKEPFVRYFQ